MTTNSARDGAGASDLIARLEGVVVDASAGLNAYFDDRGALDIAITELRRHLCECGHWLREHGYHVITEDEACWECDCPNFTPEESE